MLDGSLALTLNVLKSKVGVSRYNLYLDFLSSFFCCTYFEFSDEIRSMYSTKV